MIKGFLAFLASLWTAESQAEETLSDQPVIIF